MVIRGNRDLVHSAPRKAPADADPARRGKLSLEAIPSPMEALADSWRDR